MAATLARPLVRPRGFTLSPVTDRGKQTAAVLKALRTAKGWTQQQLADRWGITVDGYRPYERGSRQIRFGQIPSLAKALGIDEADLAARIGQWAVPDDIPGLREQAAMILGPQNADQLDDFVRELATLPPEHQKRALEMARVSVRGLQAGLSPN